MKRIGIIGAMEVEVAQLKEAMQVQKLLKRAGMDFCLGLLEEHEVVVVKSGIGKVNAVFCTQILVDEFHVDVIVNTGIAGSLRAEINIGDIVVSTDVVHHDMDATGFGYELGQVPQMDVFSFAASERLIELACEVCKTKNPEIGVFKGRVVSGDQFIADREKKEEIVNLFGGYCTEMEGAAIAQTAWLNSVEFVIIRAISDKADGSARMDYEMFEQKAIEHSVRLLRGFVKALD